jgi:hypothetical protein
LINQIKAILDGTVDINNRSQFPAGVDNRYHNLAVGRRVARDVTRERMYIGHQLCLLFRRAFAADTTPERDAQTRSLALERTEAQYVRLIGTLRDAVVRSGGRRSGSASLRANNVESGPVDGAGALVL